MTNRQRSIALRFLHSTTTQCSGVVYSSDDSSPELSLPLLSLSLPLDSSSCVSSHDTPPLAHKGFHRTHRAASGSPLSAASLLVDSTVAAHSLIVSVSSTSSSQRHFNAKANMLCSSLSTQ